MPERFCASEDNCIGALHGGVWLLQIVHLNDTMRSRRGARALAVSCRSYLNWYVHICTAAVPACVTPTAILGVTSFRHAATLSPFIGELCARPLASRILCYSFTALCVI